MWTVLKQIFLNSQFLFIKGTIYLLSPITVISLKAINLNNRGWNVVTPSDRMLSIILAESEHLDNLGYTLLFLQSEKFRLTLPIKVNCLTIKPREAGDLWLRLDNIQLPY